MTRNLGYYSICKQLRLTLLSKDPERTSTTAVDGAQISHLFCCAIFAFHAHELRRLHPESIYWSEGGQQGWQGDNSKHSHAGRCRCRQNGRRDEFDQDSNRG